VAACHGRKKNKHNHPVWRPIIAASKKTKQSNCAAKKTQQSTYESDGKSITEKQQPRRERGKQQSTCARGCKQK